MSPDLTRRADSCGLRTSNSRNSWAAYQSGALALASLGQEVSLLLRRLLGLLLGSHHVGLLLLLLSLLLVQQVLDQ